MNATVMTLARFNAVKVVTRQMQAQGLKVQYIERRIIVSAANSYLSEHPELIEQAAETVRNVPQLRTIAEREQRRRERDQRCRKQRQTRRNEHFVGYPMRTIDHAST
jgi:hypothetical protein